MPAWRWSPITVGFSAVLLIAHPSGNAFNIGVLYVLLGAATMRLLLPKYWVRGEIDLRDWLLIGSLGVLAACGYLLMIMALRAAPATTLSPFTYARLVWATLLGWLVFGDFPDRSSHIGMTIIIGSDVVVAHSERFDRKS